jgi:hypothetical protein
MRRIVDRAVAADMMRNRRRRRCRPQLQGQGDGRRGADCGQTGFLGKNSTQKKPRQRRELEVAIKTAVGLQTLVACESVKVGAIVYFTTIPVVGTKAIPQ